MPSSSEFMSDEVSPFDLLSTFSSPDVDMKSSLFSVDDVVTATVPSSNDLSEFIAKSLVFSDISNSCIVSESAASLTSLDSHLYVFVGGASSSLSCSMLVLTLDEVTSNSGSCLTITFSPSSVLVATGFV